MAPASIHSSLSDSDSDGDFSVAPARASAIQGISIHHHVPVIRDMDEGNYGQWRLFFESTLGKFGLESHILATVSKGVFDIVRRDRHDAFTLWHAVEGLFQDNELQRAVYLKTELRSLQQGDMSMTEYYTKLKRIADQLRDIGHHVSEPSQVLNLLRGLNPRYRYVRPTITSKHPPHTFQSARSFLILEELNGNSATAKPSAQAVRITNDQCGLGATPCALAALTASTRARSPRRPRSRSARSPALAVTVCACTDLAKRPLM
ncbi:unnamed protein product [Miscanthus lutarioriparius]|uniref:Retrotransposon gag domain-containing protein n=1 Tax=Miscanthus lutarioriparius TaxID=422564 RepID=A0A811MI77_9POAL|nr:unnamed protein product [Miscanthus lutarioriparius]